MSDSPPDLAQLAQSIKDWGRELGFQQVGITDVDLGEHEAHLQRWLDAGYQGEMDYMAAHGSKRSHPDELVPGTLRVVSLRMDYLPGDTRMAERLAQPEQAYVSRYALGRDYHKLVRKRLQQLAERIQAVIGPFGHRAFVDSAPVLYFRVPDTSVFAAKVIELGGSVALILGLATRFAALALWRRGAPALSVCVAMLVPLCGRRAICLAGPCDDL